jgi:hypothetical protein
MEREPRHKPQHFVYLGSALLLRLLRQRVEEEHAAVPESGTREEGVDCQLLSGSD